MPGKMKYIYTMFLILLLSCFSCKGNSNDTVSAKNGDSAVKWEKITGGLENARLQKKPVLIFFYTEWCIYCKKMDAEIFSDPEISKYMNENFISLRLNPEKDHETIELMGEKIPPSRLMEYTGSKGFPTTLFLTDQKKPLTTVPGFVERGTFLSILKYLREECYKNKIPLDDYMKTPSLCTGKKISSLEQ